MELISTGNFLRLATEETMPRSSDELRRQLDALGSADGWDYS
jgi:hypothetical protein